MKKKILITTAAVATSIIGLVGCGGKKEDSKPPETTATSTIETQNKARQTSKFNLVKMDIRTGSGNVIGQQGITRATSLDVDDSYLNEWYKEIVKDGDCKSYVIVYIDKRNGNKVTGVYASSGVTEKDVTLTRDDNGTYSLTSSGGGSIYTWNGSSLEK